MISNSSFQAALNEAVQKKSEKLDQPRVFTLSIKKRFDGFKLLDVYAQSFPHVQESFWKSKIESGNLTLDNKKVIPTHIVRAGQITKHTVTPKPEPIINTQIKLIAATTNYWVIDKPSPLPVHAGGRYQNNTLTQLLIDAFPNQKFHLINRLDANTTGIVLVALNKETAKNLGKQFENREVKKTYLALVEGSPINSEFSSTKSISKEKTPAGGRKLEEGQKSNTDFIVLSRFEHKSLLQVTPHSGRTNQIRLHLAGLQLPIVGDHGYKNPEYFKNNPLTYPEDTLYLHAWKLEFTHQVTLEKVQYVASPSKKWIDYLNVK
jgi:23S rRNA pseudouridine1911/1915/1917 synthase